MAEEAVFSIEVLAKGGFNPNRVRMLVYGESGAGKTTFAATWPGALFIDIDDGLASVRTEVHRVAATDWDTLFDIYEWLLMEPHDYQTVVIDSLNEAQRLAMEATLEQFPDVKRSYGQLPGMSDYGKSLDDFDRMTRAFKALPMNLLLIGQAEKRIHEGDVVGPLLSGKRTAGNVARMMDIIGYLYKAEGGGQNRTLTFDAVDYVSKDRSGVLPVNVENATHADLYRYWLAIDSGSEVDREEEE